MAARGSLLLLALLLLLSCSCGRGQHWSHGWYPGGKRDLRTPPNLQVPSPLGRCRPFPCPPRREEALPVSGNGAGGSWRDPQNRD
uniref:Progonadoliberin n=1 Tax=Zosterops lateralis melanops TaxID=1220523 RepID=A0A8D2PSH4_ZOSLA